MNRWGFIIGLSFGFLLGSGRVSEYQKIHDMLMLRDPYLYLMMGSAVAVAAPLLWLLSRRGWRTPFGGPLTLKRYRPARKDYLGSIVFGAGWAITGSCPGAILAMIGGGSLLGLIVALGAFSGLMLRDVVADRAIARPLPRTSYGELQSIRS